MDVLAGDVRLGFLAKIPNPSIAFLAELSVSTARIVHFMSNSLPLCSISLCLPRRVLVLVRVLQARCFLTRFVSALPVSPLYVELKA